MLTVKTFPTSETASEQVDFVEPTSTRTQFSAGVFSRSQDFELFQKKCSTSALAPPPLHSLSIFSMEVLTWVLREGGGQQQVEAMWRWLVSRVSIEYIITRVS